MKNKLTILTLILGLGSSLMFSSCSKDDKKDDGTNPNTRVDFVKAKINAAWMPIDPAATVADYEASQDVVSITAYSTDQVTLISIYFPMAVGSYGIPDDASGVLQYTNLGEKGIYDGKTGVVTITKADKATKVVEGTFSYSAKNMDDDQKNVYEGSFSYQYP